MKEVGGNDADIVVVSREDGSGTRDGFQEIVGFESGDLTSNAQISDGSGNIKTTVQGNENAIGYISFGYLDDSINSVKIGGIEPKEENVYNKKYPISRPFLLVTKGDATGDAKSFTLFAEFVITAIPSIAIWYSFNSDFSSSFKSLDDIPICEVPSIVFVI